MKHQGPYSFRLEIEKDAVAAIRCFFDSKDQGAGFGFYVTNQKIAIELLKGKTVGHAEMDTPSTTPTTLRIKVGDYDSFQCAIEIDEKLTVFRIKSIGYYRTNRFPGPVTLLIEQNDRPLLVVSNFQTPIIPEGVENLWLRSCSQTMLTGLKAVPSVKRIVCKQFSRIDYMRHCGDVGEVDSELLEIIPHNSNFYISDLSELAKFASLKSLTISGSEDNLADLSPLANLSELLHLSIDVCSRVNICGLAELRELRTLIIKGGYALDDWTPIEKLTALKSIRFYEAGIRSLDFLQSLVDLDTFIAKNCYYLEDINGLGHCPNIKNLQLATKPHGRHDSDRIFDYAAIGCLKNLELLVLDGRTNVGELDWLKNLPNIKALHMNRCSNVASLDSLPQSDELSLIHLEECTKVTNLRKLAQYEQLSSIDVRGMKRVTSISELRDLIFLKNFASDFHPGIVAELLAHAAVMRKDVPFISANAENWLKEGDGFDTESRMDQERLAATLGEAFSLLGDLPIIKEFEAFLDRHPEFSAEPWKAWLKGTYQQTGYEFYRQRVDRLDPVNCVYGAIGGVCVSLSYGDAEDEQKKWALSWLQQMENARSSEFRELLPIAPEICLAYARLDCHDGLARWLERFTDPSDPSGLDAVQSALGKLQLEQKNANQAFGHAVKIQSPLLRDSLLADIARACVESDPAMTAEIVLTIETSAIREDLVMTIAAQGEFVANANNVHALVVAAGSSPGMLSKVIGALSADTDKALVNQLSQLLAAPEKEQSQWARSRISELMEKLAQRINEPM